MNPIDFFTSTDVTLSDKLLEVFYVVNGLVALYTGWKNLSEHGGGHPLHACGDYGARPHIGSRSRGEAPRGRRNRSRRHGALRPR